ncbi:MAG TPA: hypothetical protein VGH67_22990 [Solirubrobacteraceae bacterium]
MRTASAGLDEGLTALDAWSTVELLRRQDDRRGGQRPVAMPGRRTTRILLTTGFSAG